MKNNGQNPRPTQQLANLNDVQSQRLQQQSLVPPSATPAPVRWAPEGAIQLENPEIHTVEYMNLIGKAPYNNMVKKITASRAYVMQGAIVIEELDLILPLAGAHIRTKRNAQ